MHEEDHDKIALDVKLEQEQIADDEFVRRVAVLLTTRNFQLAKFVTLLPPIVISQKTMM